MKDAVNRGETHGVMAPMDGRLVLLEEVPDKVFTKKVLGDGVAVIPDQREAADGLRIDCVWCSEAQPVARSRVVFNGTDGPAVSDRFGVLTETEET